MKKQIVALILLILLITTSFLAYSYFTKLKETQRDFLAAYCGEDLGQRDVTIEEVSGVLDNFYSEELPQKDSLNERLFGLSKSRFDTFCVVTYDQEGSVVKSGVSYD